MGGLRKFVSGKGLFQLVAPAALDEDRSPEGRQPCSQWLNRIGDLALVRVAPGFERAKPDRICLAADGDQVVALAQREGPTEIDVVALRVNPQFLHAADHKEPRLVPGRDGV